MKSTHQIKLNNSLTNYVDKTPSFIIIGNLQGFGTLSHLPTKIRMVKENNPSVLLYLKELVLFNSHATHCKVSYWTKVTTQLISNW